MAPFRRTSPAATSRAFFQGTPPGSSIYQQYGVSRLRVPRVSILGRHVHFYQGASCLAIASWLKAFAVKNIFPIQLLEPPFPDSSLQSS